MYIKMRYKPVFVEQYFISVFLTSSFIREGGILCHKQESGTAVVPTPTSTPRITLLPHGYHIYDTHTNAVSSGCNVLTAAACNSSYMHIYYVRDVLIEQGGGGGWWRAIV